LSVSALYTGYVKKVSFKCLNITKGYIYKSTDRTDEHHNNKISANILGLERKWKSNTYIIERE